MHRLAFMGTIILGLVVLVTHLVVTLIIGVGPQLVISAYDTMHEAEALKGKLADDIEEDVEEGLAKYRVNIITNQLKNDAKKTRFLIRKRLWLLETKMIGDDLTKIQ